MKKSLLLLLSSVVLLVCVPVSGQKKWKQKEKRFEPVVREDARGYAGRYVGPDESHWLDVRADDANRLTVTLYEEGRPVALRDPRLDGARITATKVYEDGRTAPFAGLFADRILNGARAFGIIVDGPVKVTEDVTFRRVFYTLR